jgi:hypothetical protein
MTKRTRGYVGRHRKDALGEPDSEDAGLEVTGATGPDDQEDTADEDEQADERV